MPIRRQDALDYHAKGRPGKIQVSPTAAPVHILQRGSHVNDIVNIAVIAALDAQEHGRRPRADP
jgi:phosphotransacetylase